MELIYVRSVPGVDPEDALARALGYLQERGYGLTEVSHGGGKLCRGFGLAGLLAGRVDRLRSRLDIDALGVPGGTQLTVRYEIDTFGQLITKTNRSFWDVEVDELCERAAGAPSDPTHWQAYHAAARRDNVRFLLISLVIAVVSAALAVGLVLWS